MPLERWALVTSCARPLAEVRLRTAGLLIPHKMVTSDDVRMGKPDPEPYLKGAALLGVPASKCIVFEDAPAGIRSGKSAGAMVVALRSTAPDHELEQAGADWIITTYSELAVKSTDHGSNGIRLHLRK